MGDLDMHFPRRNKRLLKILNLTVLGQKNQDYVLQFKLDLAQGLDAIVVTQLCTRRYHI